MKNKFFTIILVAVFLLSLISCQTADTPAPNTDTIPSYETAADINETTVFPEETVPEATVSESIGSISTPDYEVSVIDGKCYLNFTDGNEAETTAQGTPAFGGDTTYLTFSSLAEMKQKLQENTLTASEKDTIKAYFKKSDNGFEICNVTNLMTAVFPSGWNIEHVDLLGSAYRIGIGGNASAPQWSGLLNLTEYNRWDSACANEMAIIEKQTNINHTSDTFEGLPCDVYTYTTNTSTLKDVFLTIPGENGKADMNVLIIYVLDTIYPDKLTVSATIPMHVYIYSEAHGTYYDYMLLGLTEAPTVEWLSSFSIAPYVDTADHAAS